MDDNPSQASVIKSHIAAALGRVHTAMPATILTYDAVSQKATVQLSVRFQEEDPDTGGIRPSAKTPPIPNMPVIFPSGNGGGSSITWPMLPGDPVMVIFAERSTDEYRTLGGADTQAQSTRRFSLSDGVALPGYRSFNAASNTGPLPATAVDPASMVIKGSLAKPLKLGDNTAVDAAIKGTVFNLALAAFMTSLAASAVDPVVKGAAGTYISALTGNPHLSTKVKIS